MLIVRRLKPSALVFTSLSKAALLHVISASAALLLFPKAWFPKAAGNKGGIGMGTQRQCQGLASETGPLLRPQGHRLRPASGELPPTPTVFTSGIPSSSQAVA